jgi:hypothetical protein
MLLRERFAKRLIMALLLVAACIGAGLLKDDIVTRHGRYHADGDAFGRDFIAFYTAGQAALNGRAADVYDLKAAYAAQDAVVPHPSAYRPWFYPPPVFLLVRVIAMVPDYLSALLIWSVVGVAVTGYALLRLTPDRRVLLLLLCPTTVLAIRAGQISLLYASVFTLALVALRDRRHILAGILIGCLILKPQLGLMLPLALVAARQWRAFWAASGTVVALCCLSLLADGADAWRGFLASTDLFKVFLIDGLPGIGRPVLGLANVYGALLNVGTPHIYAMIGQAITGGTAALWVAYTCRREGITHHSVAVILTATLLAAPYIMAYDLVLLVPVGALILTAPRHHPVAMIGLFATVLAGLMLGLNAVLGWGGGVLWVLVVVFSLKKRFFSNH